MKKKKNNTRVITSSADGTKVEVTNIEGTNLAVWKKI